jgi:hypothetical protein
VEQGYTARRGNSPPHILVGKLKHTLRQQTDDEKRSSVLLIMV